MLAHTKKAIRELPDDDGEIVYESARYDAVEFAVTDLKALVDRLDELEEAARAFMDVAIYEAKPEPEAAYARLRKAIEE